MASIRFPTDIVQYFRPTKILARITGLDALSEKQAIEALRQPQTTKVTTESGEREPR